MAHENHDNNLVVQAARSLAELTGHELDAHLTLIKNLPVASGIGGGSSDAAAGLRALARHWGLAKNDPRIMEAAARHGQDVPVCLKTENNYMTANGVIPAPPLPRTEIVLVNPGQGLPTPEVFKEYKKGGNCFSPLARLERAPKTVDDLVIALKLRSNDLYAPACRLMPEIVEISRRSARSENVCWRACRAAGRLALGFMRMRLRRARRPKSATLIPAGGSRLARLTLDFQRRDAGQGFAFEPFQKRAACRRDIAEIIQNFSVGKRGNRVAAACDRQ